eukprot:CAMPEP_0174830970 /NCGR_PEP_ID=MMETSP1114-20130205/2830_1 /TAXON_ID=312471 /ORGANISM="Neobodo designis, Strain CCAP 1951/1" /LENGTH=49 /DNA_ID= /DNA_START= /DNA_END= /DNA_ORIENTATION=
MPQSSRTDPQATPRTTAKGELPRHASVGNQRPTNNDASKNKTSLAALDA